MFRMGIDADARLARTSQGQKAILLVVCRLLGILHCYTRNRLLVLDRRNIGEVAAARQEY